MQRALKGGLPARATSRDVAAALTQFDIPVSAVSLGQRVIYAESAARGLSVIEADPHSEAAKEITRLARTLIDGPPLGGVAADRCGSTPCPIGVDQQSAFATGGEHGGQGPVALWIKSNTSPLRRRLRPTM